MRKKTIPYVRAQAPLKSDSPLRLPKGLLYWHKVISIPTGPVKKQELRQWLLLVNCTRFPYPRMRAIAHTRQHQSEVIPCVILLYLHYSTGRKNSQGIFGFSLTKRVGDAIIFSEYNIKKTEGIPSGQKDIRKCFTSAPMRRSH